MAFGFGKSSALGQLYDLLRPFKQASQRNAVAALAAGLIAAIGLNAVGQIRLNTWQGAFFDAISRRQVEEFGHQLLVFLAIVSFLLGLGVAQTWIQQMIRVHLRDWLTQDLLNAWLKPRRPFWLGYAGDFSANPDQRIHEDARHLTELSTDLGIGLLQSSLLLVSFVGVLWGLSAQVVFPFQGQEWSVPGYMVWCALAYAGVGSWLSWRVGRPLIALNAERYAREAEFRFSLVRISEHADGIAVYGGETDERRAIALPLRLLIAVMTRLANGLARLSWVTSGYGWLAIVVPIIVAAPGYFSGELSFGGLMMVVGAFNQVQQALRWFVDNIAQIADWRATLFRVAGFRQALNALETLGADAGRIRIVDDPAGHLGFEDFGVSLPDGAVRLKETAVEIRPGERVLIAGEARSGKSTFFRAMAGLWPWGTGTLALPPRDGLMFIPQRPYLPIGRLRDVLAYPDDPERFDDAALTAALKRTGLDHLTASLDHAQRWDHNLSIGEQQRIAFARLVLHKPAWIFLDEAVDTCEAEHHGVILSIFEHELAGATVISMGQDAGDHFYSRTLHLIRLPGGVPLRLNPDAAPPADAPAPVAQPAAAPADAG